MKTPADMMKRTSVVLPSAKIEAEAEDSGLVVTSLRYAMGPREQGKPLVCYWGTVSSDAEQQDEYQIEILSFAVDDMSRDEVAKKIVLLAMERLIKNGVQEFNIHICQEILRRHIEGIRDIFPNLRIMYHAHKIGLHQSVRLLEHLNAVIAPLFSERDRQVRAENDAVFLSPQRCLYVDASVAIGGENVGFGCVTKDEISNSATGEQYWNLIYTAAMTTISKRDGSTGAELQAILEAIDLPGVITHDIRHGKRSLTIVSDSKWGIELLNALRHGTTPQIAEKIKANWWRRADRITQKLSNIENVEFEWVKGHGDDLLNDAADRLAISERRNERVDIPLDTREVVKKNILTHTVECLNDQGINAVARDLHEVAPKHAYFPVGLFGQTKQITIVK